MPMQLTVSRNCKRSANYNSEGHGLSLTVELDQSLLNDPEQLQGRIDALYREADVALDREVGAVASEEHTGHAGHHSGVTAPNGDDRETPRGMTASQRRAIFSIAEQAGVEAAAVALDALRKPLDDLTIREASRLIDHLKRACTPQLQNTGGPNSGNEHRNGKSGAARSRGSRA